MIARAANLDRLAVKKKSLLDVETKRANTERRLVTIDDAFRRRNNGAKSCPPSVWFIRKLCEPLFRDAPLGGLAK